MGLFLMPSLGADMEYGTVLEWLVRPGDVVHRGDIVAVVDTEKSDIEVEVFEDGVVEELLAEVGVELPVGAPLARLGALVGAAPEPAVAAAPEAAAPEPDVAATPGPAPAPPAALAPPRQAAFTRASPLARRVAAERGVDLAAVDGSGPDGAVVAGDLDDRAAPAPRPERRRGGREALASLMARSKREVPHYYLATTIDLSAALTWLGERNAARPVGERVLPAAMLLRATALAARQVPVVNGWWQDDAFEPSEAVHLGVAIARRGGGLVAPVLRDADERPLDELMTALRDLVNRARAGSLRSSEASGATLTVTNLGDQGVEEVLGVIHPPQVALVGFGKVVERPWASGGMVGARPTVRATLSADHRASDGHDGARFLAAIDHLLQAPEDL